MTSAIYFGAFIDIKFLHVENLKDIRHFILVDQLPTRVKYFPEYSSGYTKCINELVFISSLYHELCKQNVQIIDMVQRVDFVKFIILRQNAQITIDYYYNTTLEDALTISELEDIMKNVNTLILCGYNPFDEIKDELNLTFDHIPNVKHVWLSGDEVDYESKSIYLKIEKFKRIMEYYCNDCYDYWYDYNINNYIYEPTDYSSDDDSSDESNNSDDESDNFDSGIEE